MTSEDKDRTILTKKVKKIRAELSYTGYLSIFKLIFILFVHMDEIH